MSEKNRRKFTETGTVEKENKLLSQEHPSKIRLIKKETLNLNDINRYFPQHSKGNAVSKTNKVLLNTISLYILWN